MVHPTGQTLSCLETMEPRVWQRGRACEPGLLPVSVVRGILGVVEEHVVSKGGVTVQFGDFLEKEGEKLFETNQKGRPISLGFEFHQTHTVISNVLVPFPEGVNVCRGGKINVVCRY